MKGIKNKKAYEGLRRDGKSKASAAKISNAQAKKKTSRRKKATKRKGY
jgi:hypothetical protein